MGTGIMLARLLGPIDRGHLAAAMLWPNLVSTIGGLGLGEAVAYFTASMPGKERTVFGSGLAIAFGLSAVLGACWYIACPVLLGRYGYETVQASLYMVLSIPLALLSMVTVGALLGAINVQAYNRLRLGGAILTALGLLVLYGMERRSLTVIVFVYVVVGVLTLGYSVVVLAHHRGVAIEANRTIIRRLLSYGVRSHMGTLSSVANDRADQALISIVLPAVSLGLYSIAGTLPTVVATIGGSLSAIALPTVAAAESDMEKGRRLAQFARSTLFLSMLAALAFYSAAPLLIKFFFGPDFLPATPVTQVLLIAAILFGFNRVTSAGLRAFNRPFSAGAGDILAAVVTILSLTLLVPIWGLMGAAIASLLAYSVNFLLNVWICRWLGIRLRELLIPTSSDVRWMRATIRRAPAIYQSWMNR
jgi:O-antigen/teichoic acid export membrane protein